MITLCAWFIIIIPELKVNQLKFYLILQIKFELFTLFFSLSFSVDNFYLTIFKITDSSFSSIPPIDKHVEGIIHL